MTQEPQADATAFGNVTDANGDAQVEGNKNSLETVAAIVSVNVEKIKAMLPEIDRIICSESEMNATLHVNFGENGKVIPGIIKNSDCGIKALVIVLERLAFPPAPAAPFDLKPKRLPDKPGHWWRKADFLGFVMECASALANGELRRLGGWPLVDGEYFPVLTPAEVQQDREQYAAAKVAEARKELIELHDLALEIMTKSCKVNVAAVQKERDHAESVADSLAGNIARLYDDSKDPADIIGEHSNINCPWTRALELAAELHPYREEMSRRTPARDDLKAVKKIMDQYDEFNTVYDPECELPSVAQRVYDNFCEVLRASQPEPAQGVSERIAELSRLEEMIDELASIAAQRVTDIPAAHRYGMDRLVRQKIIALCDKAKSLRPAPTEEKS